MHDVQWQIEHAGNSRTAPRATGAMPRAARGTRMRVNLLLSIVVWMLLAIPIPGLSDEIQKMTVAQLVDKCTSTDLNSAAFCNGLATGVLNQLQANGLIFGAQALGIFTSADTNKVLKFVGSACGNIEPETALIAFINWAKIHPELRGYHGITGVATAIKQAWPCKE
jgi:hypothetical protein